MSDIVEEFRRLRDAITLSEHQAQWVYPCLAMVRTLEALLHWRHVREHGELREAVKGLICRAPGSVQHALGCLDALERAVIGATLPPEAAAPRRVGHLMVLQGGRAA